MTSSVTPWLSYPILIFSALVVAGRVAVAGGSRSFRRVTAGVGFLLWSGLLREGAAQDWIARVSTNHVDVQLVRQISTVMLMLAMVPLVVMGARWVIGNRIEPWNRRIYLAAGLSSLTLLAIGTRARATGDYIDVTRGWETIAYFGLFSAWTAAMATLYLSVAIRELRRGSLPRPAVIMIVAIALLSLWGVEESVSIATSGVAAGLGTAQDFVHWRVAANENNLIYILLMAAGYTAVPLAFRLRELVGIDRWSRTCKTLFPLWADLTCACPEVLLTQVSLTPPDSRQRTHRMCVEIRDALSVLSRFHPADEGPTTEVDTAKSIAASAARRHSGVPPGPFRSFGISSGTHLEDEVRILACLAKNWDTATPLHLQPTAADMTTNSGGTQ